MKVKRFLEYSKGEQRNLLMHWWYYYSKTQYDFMEYTKFRKAVEKDAQVVMYMVFNATLNERGNEEILAMMRNGKFEEYEAGMNMEMYAWYVWEKGFEGEPTLRWMHNDR